MKVIFLDIDGVLTPYYRKYRLSLEKIKLICDIIKETEAKIVISSSWRHGSKDAEEFVRKNLYNAPFRLEEGLQEAANEYGNFIDAIVGLTDTIHSIRGEQIQRYLDSHPEIENYVIIDDDSDMLDDQLCHFVQTDTYEGITEREVRLAIDVLKNNPIVGGRLRLNKELWYQYRQKQ